ncbi:MAG: hypothetical protein IT162_15885 [Bryobacterales bacterium]|nr:hypothetical protein [Bryobacterales bacterium]
MNRNRSVRSARRKGTIILTFALGTFVLCGFAGLALDVAYLQMWQRRAQTAADAGAVAGALDLKRTRDSASASNAAFNDAAANGFAHNEDETEVTVESPPASGPHEGSTRHVRVSVRRSLPTYFMTAFGRPRVTVGATAAAGLADTGYCVVVLDPAVNAALHVSGTPSVNIGCSVQVNSASPSALHVTGSATIATAGFNVVGETQISPNASVSPTPNTGMSPEDDPLAWRANPPAGATCDHINFKVSGGGSGGGGGNGNGNGALAKGGNGNGNGSGGNGTEEDPPVNLEPGTYCGGIDLSTQRTVNFAAGLYVLQGGGLKITSGAAVNGTDVTFFNTGSASYAKGNISITGQATVNLRAPRSGPYEAMLIWEDRNLASQGPNHVEGGTESNLEGIIYMPRADLNYAGGSGTTAAYTAVVVNTLKITGHSRFAASHTVLANGAPIVRSVLLQ